MQKILLIVLPLCLLSCEGQTRQAATSQAKTHESKVVGGPFENGEFMYIGMPEHINSTDTSAGWAEPGQKLLIKGVIYQRDGKTPAPDVTLYYYHTDSNGLYATKPGLDRRVARHGYLRGWVKSDNNGQYEIYTIRPAPYPNSDIEAHIHVSVKEPAIDKEYYLDDFVFDDDQLLTGEKRKKLPNRGGSGVLRVLLQGDLQVAEHNIVLGLNIPNYPSTSGSTSAPGLEIGEDQPSFMPFHAFGPDKGTRTCPVCKYGRYHGILYFVGNHPDWEDIRKWLTFFEDQSKARGKYLKVYFVYGNQHNYSRQARQKELEEIGNELGLQHVALTFVPSLTDHESEANLNKLDPAVGNAIVIYKHRTIIDKYLDLKATNDAFGIISGTLDKTKGEFFNLEEPKQE